MKTLLVTSRAGCLLPLLIFFNLFFGWLIFPVHLWLAAEGILIMLFIFNACVLLRNVQKMADDTLPRRKGAIDVEGKIVDDKS